MLLGSWSRPRTDPSNQAQAVRKGDHGVCAHTRLSEVRMLTGDAPHSHGLGDTRAGKTAKGLCGTEIAAQ